MSESMAEGIAGVLAAHAVEYREWYLEDGWNMIYKSICRSCGELPEAPNESAHQSEQLVANGYGKLEGLVVEDASIEDADAYPDGTVIVDNQGEAWQKSGGMWYLAVGGYTDTGPADYLPVTVLRVGSKPA